MGDKIRNVEQHIKLGVLLFVCLVVIMIGQKIGLTDFVSGVFSTFGKNVAGYEERITMTKTQGREPIPILGTEYIEQEIYIGEEVINAGKLMLEIDVANYVRINQGELYVDIKQGDVLQTYVTDVSKITTDKMIRLVADVKNYEAGNVCVKFYAPTATSDNCIAVYVLNDLEVYTNLNVNGTITDKNACIDLAIPADHVIGDFVFIEEQ